MKKRTKFLIGGAVLATGVIALASCTKSFCSVVDQGRMLYAFDPGVTRYEQGGSETITVTNSNGQTYTVSNLKLTYATWNSEINGFQYSESDKLTYLNQMNSDAISAGIVSLNGANLDYYKALDNYVIKATMLEALSKRGNGGNITIDASTDAYSEFNRDVYFYSYVKFVVDDTAALWEKWSTYDAEVRKTVDEDKCPSGDFINLYKSKMNSYVANYRTCLTTKTDKFGTYGYETNGVYIEAKTWAYAWQKGFFEGLLVYPIGWLIDQIDFGFRGQGVANGWAALLAILFVTLIIRSIMMLATLKQTAGNAKMTELQPEIAKIQNKYPNANTSQVEKQRMAEEMNRLYKKNKINPFSAIIVMIFQFPIFICVWGALSGSAVLSSGTVWGLDLSLTIRDVLFNQSNWWPQADGFRPAVTALFLFILMALAQAAAMLLPQFMQKRRAAKVAKLGKNPAQNSQANKMKWFTYIMLAMIIFMGFSLVSAMGVYWFVGALVSLAQTLIMQFINDHRKSKN